MSRWLEGKRALVVGAGAGIGRAVVDAFLGEGAQVGVLERDPAKCEALSDELPQVPVVAGDATTQAANEKAVGKVCETFGGLDVLVNCVGIFDFYRGIGELDASLIEMPSRRSTDSSSAPGLDTGSRASIVFVQ